ncbi:MAG TPA: cytochrome P450 [Streptosporangiaceae bacterium]|nr:cytochrome P450 [Streptosporangiaceae bacterium]
MNARSARNAVPGPRGSAAAAALASLARSPLDGYVRLAARYGDAIRLPYAPGHSVYLLSRPEHAEHVLAAGQDNYVKAFTYRPLRALIGDGLLTSEGERWRQHRRLVQPVFSRRHVTGFGPVMTQSAQRMAARWDSLAGGSVINVSGQMSALALDIVGRALFGADLSGDADRVGRAMDAGQRVAVMATFLPLRWGPASTRAVKALARRVGGTPEGIEGPVGRIVSARRAAARLAPGAGDAPGDLLDVLLGARAQDGSPLADGEIADEVATFMLAGHETTANTLSWSLALLSAYPSARQRLEAELDSVLGGRDPDAGDAGKLAWTRAVVAEAMRLYPPAWTIERDALADDEVAGVPVPAGSLVATPPYLVHRHPDFWDDPAGFDPGRFLPPDDRPRHRYAYLPFGGGRRACVGASFAELETVLVLATIARRYRLELTVRGMPRPSANITLRPGRALPMRLIRRQ